MGDLWIVARLGNDGACNDPECCGGATYEIDAAFGPWHSREGAEAAKRRLDESHDRAAEHHYVLKLEAVPNG